MTDSQSPLRLFVYGTLIPGRKYHWMIQRYLRSARPGSIEGVLLDLGPYPALVPGRGMVRGVVLDLDPDALRVADWIEQYDPARHRGEYLRKEVTVRLDGPSAVAEPRHVTAWVYEFAEPERLHRCPPLVVGTENGVPVHAWPRPDGS